MDVKMVNVNFGYNEDEIIIHDINLELTKPGLICVIGPNGVGKSTLIKCINKLLTPTTGDVYIDGKNIKYMSYKEISQFVGYVPAMSDAFFPKTVIETVLMGRYPHQKWSYSEEDLKIVYDTLTMLNIQDLAMRDFGELSAGQHQRVMIAKGLAQRPKLLVLDEPTSNLDVKHQLIVTETLKNLAIKNKMIVLIISHDLNIAAKYADQIIMMSTPGIIYKVGTPNEVITEDSIEHVYEVRCQILEIEERPHVVLLHALTDEENGSSQQL